MAKRRQPPEYSEDSYSAEEIEEQLQEGMDQDTKSKIIMGSSWGISFVVHLILILILTLIYLAKPVKKKPPKVISRPPIKQQELNEELPLAMEQTPPVDSPKQVKQPVKQLTPTETKNQTPKGDPNNMANKNLDSNRTMDAIGPAGGAAGAYGSRHGTGKYANHGGSAGSESAVQAALRWLRRHQAPDGHWTSYDYTRYCSPKRVKCKNIKKVHPEEASNPYLKDYAVYGMGMEGYDVGVTALALLAFLGNGHTTKTGTFKKVVLKGIEWLKDVQVNDPSSKWHGSIGYIMKNGEKVKHPEWIYNHAIATMALADAYAQDKDFTLKEYAQRAVDFAVKCQNPGQGWRYDDRNPERAIKPGISDTSVTGWMVLALKAAKSSGPEEDDGLRVPKEAFLGAIKWFNYVTGKDGKAGYQDSSGASSALIKIDHSGNPILRNGRGVPRDYYEILPTMTAVSVLCRLFAGQSPSSQSIKKGVKILMAHKPKWEGNDFNKTVNMYYWYYATYALEQIGGKNWTCNKKYSLNDLKKGLTCSCWNHAMQRALLLNQRYGKINGKRDCAHGSWDPVGEWCIAGGRVYSTAIGALTLEVYYRYADLTH
ncbi:MAG: hypothetical protein D6805_08070 [Planctomycetota bacterium]|nr:MAG: hypothetical protein D6805_08070 [Planctomycetota bacterium]